MSGSFHHTDLSLLPGGIFSLSEHRAVLRHYPLVSLSHCTQDPPWGRESITHCIPSPAIPLPPPDFPAHPTGQQVWLPNTKIHVCPVVLGAQELLQMIPGWHWAPSACASPVLGTQPGEDSTKWKLSLGKARQCLTSPWQRCCSSFLSHFFSSV